MTTVVIYLPAGTTTWTVPSDWNPNNNLIEGIGAGGGAAAAGNRTGGPGGGAYSNVSNLALTPGATVYVSVGAGGSSTGGDTWFNKSANTAPTSSTDGILAKGGSPTTSGAAGQPGGQASSGVGTVKHSGGTGGTGNTSSYGGGGGGAGGANGDGVDGSTYNGGAGDAGLGGAGGLGGNGNNGAAGTEWDATHGSGGGGGGGNGGSYSGGDGGLYGGGAGQFRGPGGSGGLGANGIIRISYTPSVPVNVAVTGSAITSAVGNATPKVSIHVNPTGASASFATGAAIALEGAIEPVTGSDASFGTGTVTVTGGANILATGSAVSASFSSVLVATGITFTVTGLSLNLAAGSVSVFEGEGVVVTPAGSALSATAGNADAETAVTPTGAGASFAAGSVTVRTGTNFTVTGTSFAAASGVVAESGGASVYVTGQSLTALTGIVVVTAIKNVNIALTGEAVSTYTGEAGEITGVNLTLSGETLSSAAGDAQAREVNSANPSGSSAQFGTGQVQVNWYSLRRIDLSQAITVSRSSTYALRQIDGTYAIIPADTLPISKNIGAIFETEATNLTLWSEDLTKWTGVGAIGNPGSTIKRGSLILSAVNTNGTSSDAYLKGNTFTVEDGGYVLMSYFVRKGKSNAARTGLLDETDTVIISQEWSFDGYTPVRGAISYTGAMSIEHVDSGFEDTGANVFRLWSVFQNVSGEPITCRALPFVTSGDTRVLLPAHWIGGIMTAISPKLVPYVPSKDSVTTQYATDAAFVQTVVGAAHLPFKGFQPELGAFTLDFDAPANDGLYKPVLSLSDGTADERLDVAINEAGSIVFEVSHLGATTTLDFGTVSQGVQCALAIAYDAESGTLRGSLNGVDTMEVTGVISQSMSTGTLAKGSWAGANYADTIIRSVGYVKSFLDSDALKGLSTDLMA